MKYEVNLGNLYNTLKSNVAKILLPVAAAGIMYAAQPKYAQAADLGTFGEVISNLNSLPNNSAETIKRVNSGHNLNIKGAAYNTDFRSVDSKAETTSANEVFGKLSQSQLKTLDNVFGANFSTKLVDGDMSNYELQRIEFSAVKSDNKVRINMHTQYGKDPVVPAVILESQDLNITGYTDAMPMTVETTIDVLLQKNGSLKVTSLKINGTDRKGNPADALNVLYQALSGYKVTPLNKPIFVTDCADQPIVENPPQIEVKPYGKDDLDKKVKDINTASNLSVSIADKGNHPLLMTSGGYETALGNPYNVSLVFAGSSEGEPKAVTNVSVVYTPLQIVAEKRDASGTVVATYTVPIVDSIKEAEIETTLSQQLSNMTPASTSTVATGTTQVNFATSTVFPELGRYDITAVVNDEAESAAVTFPTYAKKDNNAGAIAGTALGVILLYNLLDNGSDNTAPAANNNPTPATPDPDTQLLGGEQDHPAFVGME